MTNPCFTERDLRNYALGACDDSTSQAIEKHLERCPACEETLAGFDDTGDTLVRHLPLAASAAAEPALADDRPGWLDRLRSGPPADGAGAAQPVGDVATLAPPLVESSAYELLGVLGQGGMGVVYRARHRQLNRVVALKVLHPRLTSAPEARQRFDREIRVLGSLHHPGVVMATDAGKIGAASYLVMELIDGIDLSRLVRRSGPLSVAEACSVGRDMASALAAAHQAGAIHRDVKPSNVMIDRAGRVKLLDFGLAHLATVSTDDPETSLGQLLGTLEYMAPEQAGPEGELDARVDLFGIGATLFYLLTGRSPRGTGTRRTLLEQLRSLTDQSPDIRTLRADVPAELAELIARLLDRDPAARPQSADQVARDLAQWSGGNLAERATDALATAAEPQPADTPDEAQRSLSRLLGVFPVEGGSQVAGSGSAMTVRGQTSAADGSYGTDGTATATPPRRFGRRNVGWLAALAGCAAVIFGVTIVLDTPEGKIVIESDVADVRVEAVDTNDQPHALTIDKDAAGTRLRAGKYTIRIASEHDGLSISPSEVIVSKGKTKVAKITRLEVGTAVAGKTTEDGGGAKTDRPGTGRLYQGQPESVWQRGFEVERDPVAKISAARALITFAADLPAEQQIDHILAIGAGLVESGWGDDALLFAMPSLGGNPLPDPESLQSPSERAANRSAAFARGGAANRASGRRRASDPAQPATATNWPNVARWQVTSELTEAWNNLLALMRGQLIQLPTNVIVDRLAKPVVAGSPAQAAFACWALANTPMVRHIEQDPAALRPLFARLSIAVAGLDQTAVATLLRAKFAAQATPEERSPLGQHLNDLARRLAGSDNDELRPLMMTAWFAAVRRVPVDASVAAELVYRRLLDDPSWGNQYLSGSFDGFRPGATGTVGNPDGSVVSGPAVLSTVAEWSRERYAFFLPAWISICNRHLSPHSENDEVTGVIVRSIGNVLRMRLPADNWDVDTTARLLTDRLRRFYYPGPFNFDEVIAGPVTPGMLLANIVRITGAVPEFARPAPEWARDQIAVWKEVLESVNTPIQRVDNRSHGLLHAAPYETLRLALAADLIGVGRIVDRTGRRSTVQGASQQVERILALWPGTRTPNRRIGLDSLLLLAVMSDLAGTAEAQDQILAAIFASATANREEQAQRGSGSSATVGFDGVQLLLSDTTATQQAARTLLRKIRDRTQDATLRDAINKLDPTLAAADFAADKPAKAPASDRLYQGQPEAVWQRGFEVERDPVAKITAARALITFASDLPAEQQIDRIVAIGAALVESGWGEEALVFPMAALGATTRTVTPRQTAAPARSARSTGRTAAPSDSQLRGGFGVTPDGRRATALNSQASVMTIWPKVPRWQVTTELDQAWTNLLNLIQGQLAQLPAPTLVARLAPLISGDKNTSAAFAAWVLADDRMTRQLVENEAALGAFFDTLPAQPQPDRPDQSVIATLLAARFVARGDGKHLPLVTSRMNAAATRLSEASESELRSLLAVAWTIWVGGLSVDPAKGAEVVYLRLLDNPEWAQQFFPQIPASGSRQLRSAGDAIRRPAAPRADETGEEAAQRIRAPHAYFLPAWIAVCNRHLEQSQTDDPVDGAVIQSIGALLQVRVPNDNWDVQTTARLLTERLRRYYADDAPEYDDIVASAVTPALLLTNIVRITGNVPEFAREASKCVGDRIDVWKNYLQAEYRNEGVAGTKFETLEGILDVAPYAALHSALLPEVLISRVSRSNLNSFSMRLNTVLRRTPGIAVPTRLVHADPLLLLAVISDVAGRNDDLDGALASYFAYVATQRGQSSVENIPRLLNASTPAIRQTAAGMLSGILGRTSNAALRDAIAKLDPALFVNATPPRASAPADTEPPARGDSPRGAPTARPAPVERLFKGETEAVWQQRFDAEVDPVARLAAAEALVTLAAARPAAERVDRIVEIGAALFEAGWGEDLLNMPLKVLSAGRSLSIVTTGNRADVGNSRSDPNEAGRVLWGTTWRVTTELSRAWGAFVGLIDQHLAQVPSQELGERIAATVSHGEPAPACFAIFTAGMGDVRTSLRRNVKESQGAAFTRLGAPPGGLDQGALAALLRATLISDAVDDDQRRLVAEQMNDLAARLAKAPAGEVRLRMIAAWLTATRGLPVDPKAHATLVYELLPFALQTGLEYDFGVQGINSVEPYRVRQRSGDRSYLTACAEIANERLSTARTDWEAATTVHSLDYLLRQRLPDDSWDVATTARLLTERLRRYYEASEQPATDNATPLGAYATPALLLTNLLRITGDIPEFARPAPARVENRVQLWKELQRSNSLMNSETMDPRKSAQLVSLIEVAPYQALQVMFASGVTNQWNQLRWIKAPNEAQSPGEDPLLVLAVLADICGRDAAQDEHFAKMIRETNPSSAMLRLAPHLDDMVAGPTAIKPIAHNLLQKMWDRSQNAKLREALQKVDATVGTRPGERGASAP